MSSTTSNYISQIQQGFPIAGQANDSQGFRDNFKNIALALGSANQEINNLVAAGASSVTTATINTAVAAAIVDISATQTVSVASAAQIEIAGTGFTDIASQSISTLGNKPVLVWANCSMLGAHSTGVTAGNMDAQIGGVYWKFNSAISGISFQIAVVGGSNPTDTLAESITVFAGQASEFAAHSVFTVSNLPAGTYTFKLQAKQPAGGLEPVGVRSSRLTIMETQR